MKPEGQFADEFDCALFDLLQKAERRCEKNRMGYRHDKVWTDVAWLLSRARERVRTRMHPKDRAATS